jgi:hypothetical protein
MPSSFDLLTCGGHLSSECPNVCPRFGLTDPDEIACAELWPQVTNQIEHLEM